MKVMLSLITKGVCHSASWEKHNLASSLNCNISLSFCLFSYNGVCFKVLKLSVGDVIVSQKGSNGNGKLQLFGWDYRSFILSASKYCSKWAWALILTKHAIKNQPKETHSIVRK